MEELFDICVILVMVAGTIIVVCGTLFLSFLMCLVIKKLIEELFD